MYQTRTHQRCSAQAIITPPSALTFVRVWSARSAVEECVFLLKDQGPNHDEQLSAASKKKKRLFLFFFPRPDYFKNAGDVKEREPLIISCQKIKTFLNYLCN